MKAIVFLSCADSVDFHFEVFARVTDRASVITESESPKMPLAESTNGAEINLKPVSNYFGSSTPAPRLSTVSQTSTLSSAQNPDLTLYKLHGSLTQPLRTATLSAFTHSSSPSILFCTDVASRGLDMPNIDLVIEYDPPFSSDDHLHRVGRTARVGREGRAMIFLMPGEEEGYVDVLKRGYRDEVGNALKRIEAEELLKKGFGPPKNIRSTGSSGLNWQERVTEWQLRVERWILEDKSAAEMARKAFISQVRAYATHVAKERQIFNVKGLHLGHLAKAFALRERPGNMGQGIGRGDRVTKSGQRGDKRLVEDGEVKHAAKNHHPNPDAYHGPETDGMDAAKRMKMKMKEHMAAAGEFNIA